MPVTQADLDNRFDFYHPPSTDVLARKYELIRDIAKEFAETVVEQVPEGREQSLTLTHIEDAMMWANAGIARNQ